MQGICKADGGDTPLRCSETARQSAAWLQARKVKSAVWLLHCVGSWKGGVSATRDAPPCPALLLRSRPPIPAPGQAGPGGVTMAGFQGRDVGAERDLAARLPTVASDLGPTGSWGMIGLRGEALRFWESSSRRFQSRILQYYFTTVAPKETK